MRNTCGIPHVASMGLDGGCSLGIPWNASMANALGFHGLALVLLIGNSILSALWVCHWDVQMELPWHCFMGNALGLQGLALGLLIGNSMEVVYG